MKLSDVKGDRTFDVLADIFEAVCDIAKDKRVYKLFTKRTLPKGMDTRQFSIQIVLDAADSIVKYHKDECIKIMSSIEGISEEEYVENLDMLKLVNDVIDLIYDPQIQTLFFLQTPTDGTPSGSASESTAE